MKNVFSVFLFVLSANISAYGGNFLEGDVYERTFESQPLGAPTPMQFTHTLTFGSDWSVTDNSSTWFGNPPNKCAYGVELTRDKSMPGRVTIICNGNVTRFQYVKKGDTIALKNKSLALTLKQKTEL